MGHTKGGLNTKVAATVDAFGRPVELAVASGPHHDLLACAPFLPSLRACWLLADRWFDADEFPRTLVQQGAQTCIPPWTDCAGPAASAGVFNGSAMR